MSTFATPDEDRFEREYQPLPAPVAMFCLHCGREVIKNYDGRGTGWFHLGGSYPTRCGGRQ